MAPPWRAIPDRPGFLQLVAEHALRGSWSLWVVMNIKKRLRHRQHAAAHLADNAAGVGVTGYLVQFVEQDAGRFDPGHHGGVEGLDLQRRLGLAVDDFFQMVPHMEPLLKEALLIGLDHADACE